MPDVSLVWSEEQSFLRETARSFLDEKSPVSELRRLRDERDPEGFSRKLWAEMVELGWAGIPFAEELGGAGLGYSELGAVMLECGRTLAATPLLASAGLGASALHYAGAEAQKKQWIGALCAGRALLGAGIQEGPHHAPFSVETRATRSGEKWSLSGRKDFVLDGSLADAVVVVARVDGDAGAREGLSLFLVERERGGVEVSGRVRVDGRNTASWTFEDVELGTEACIGTPGEAADTLERVIDGATALLCAEMLGGLEAAFEKTLAYLKVREQFGVPIGSFQALKHRAAKMFIAQEYARSMVLEALHAADENPPERSAIVSAAKAQLGEAVHLIGNEGVQMHGGIGVTDEEDIGLFMKRFRVQEHTLGNGRFHRDRYATTQGF